MSGDRMPSLLGADEALRRLTARASLTDAEAVALDRAVGRAVAERRLRAPIDVPPFANSAMDGFALRVADTPGTLRIAGEVAAGRRELPHVAAGTAVRIMTGAPMPPGADTVVPVEDVAEAEDRVTIANRPVAGAYVRAAGNDIGAGDELCLPPVVTPAAIAMLASLGIGSVAVRRRPRVAILSTGDELVPPGDPLAPGQIYDSNGPSLAAAVAEAGGAPIVVERQRDDEAAIEAALRAAAASSDLVISSGGVSVGRHDHVRHVLERRGALDFWRIAVQPGKPLAVGELDGTTVIGLPGNPVSALVTFELFVRPIIRAALGLAGDGRQRTWARIDERLTKDPQRRAFLRVSVRQERGEMLAVASGGQGSAQLQPLVAANALLVVPEGREATEPGTSYEAILLEPLP